MTWPAAILDVNGGPLGEWTAPSLPEAGDSLRLPSGFYYVRSRVWNVDAKTLVIVVESATPVRTPAVK